VSLLYRINKLVVPPSISDKIMMIISVDVRMVEKIQTFEKIKQIKSNRIVEETSPMENKRIVFNFSFTNGTARRTLMQQRSD
jgi:hypothetical protein